MPAEQATQRFRVGEVPPLAEGYTDRPDTARGIVEMLVPGKTLALVPGSAFAEGPSNWLGACGKTQIAVIIAESLWRSGAIDVLDLDPRDPPGIRAGGLCRGVYAGLRHRAYRNGRIGRGAPCELAEYY